MLWKPTNPELKGRREVMAVTSYLRSFIINGTTFVETRYATRIPIMEWPSAHINFEEGQLMSRQVDLLIQID